MKLDQLLLWCVVYYGTTSGSNWAFAQRSGNLQSGIIFIDYIYSHYCVSLFDNSGWERQNGDRTVTLSALCNVFLSASQKQLQTGTQTLSQKHEFFFKGSQRLGVKVEHYERTRNGHYLRFSGESPWLWMDLLADILLQWISFKSSFSSVNVTTVKSCITMSDRALRVSVCTPGSWCWVTPPPTPPPPPPQFWGVKNKAGLCLLCTVPIALEIQCSIGFERKQLLISSCRNESPVLTKACRDTEKKEKRWKHPWGFAWN